MDFEVQRWRCSSNTDAALPCTIELRLEAQPGLRPWMWSHVKPCEAMCETWINSHTSKRWSSACSESEKADALLVDVNVFSIYIYIYVDLFLLQCWWPRYWLQYDDGCLSHALDEGQIQADTEHTVDMKINFQACVMEKDFFTTSFRHVLLCCYSRYVDKFRPGIASLWLQCCRELVLTYVQEARVDVVSVATLVTVAPFWLFDPLVLENLVNILRRRTFDENSFVGTNGEEMVNQWQTPRTTASNGQQITRSLVEATITQLLPREQHLSKWPQWLPLQFSWSVWRRLVSSSPFESPFESPF